MKQWIQTALDSCLPGYCLLCAAGFDPTQPSPADHLCSYCRLALPLNLHACYHCALPLYGETTYPQPAQLLVCGSCISKPLAPRTFAPLIHEGTGAYLLHQLKFNAGEAEGRTLAAIMLAQIRPYIADSPPDLLLPVPLDYWSLVKRGFNQSSLLAAALGSALHIPVVEHLVTRRRGPAQRTLSRAQRQQLAGHRFLWRGAGKPLLQNQHVAIIDDVLTTGATARQLIHLLKQHGASTIEVWCATRAEAPQH